MMVYEVFGSDLAIVSLEISLFVFEGCDEWCIEMVFLIDFIG